MTKPATDREKLELMLAEALAEEREKDLNRIPSGIRARRIADSDLRGCSDMCLYPHCDCT